MKGTILRRFGAFLPVLFLWGGLGLPPVLASETEGNSIDWATTAELAERRLNLKPKDNAAWENLVESRIRLEDFTRAAEALRLWRSYVPGVSKSYPMVERLTGDLACSQGNFEEAVQAWQLYVQRERKDIKGWDRLAWGLERQKRLPEAVDAVSNALKIKAEAGHFAWRARLKIAQRDWDGAATDLQAGNKLDATNDDIKALFPKFERSGEWLPRMKALDKAVNANGHDAAPLMERVEWLASQDFSDLAYEDAAEAARRNPRSLRAKVWRGLLAWERGEGRTSAGDVVETDREKLKRFNENWALMLRRIDQENTPETRAKAMMDLHQPVLAFKEVEAVDGSPTKPLALLALKETPKAGEAARRAVEVNPESADAWEAMANVNLVNGNPREALQNIDRCEQLNPAGKYSSLRNEAKMALGNK